MDPVAARTRVTAETRLRSPGKGHLADPEPDTASNDTIVTSTRDQAVDALKKLGQKQVADLLLGKWEKPMNELWSVEVSESYPVEPVMDEKGILYTRSGKGNSLSAIKDGKELWKADNPAFSPITTPAMGADGTLYVGGERGELIALKDGKVQWRFDGKDSVVSTPAAGPDGTVYMATDYGYWKGKLFAVDNGGKEKWQFEFPDHSLPRSSPAVGPDGTVYIGCATGRLFAVRDGKLAWEFHEGISTYGKDICSRPLVGPDGTIYFGSSDCSIYAVKDGVLSWKFKTGGALIGDMTLGPDGTIYTGSSDHKIYAVKDGHKVWDFQTGGKVMTQPILAPDGTLYAGSEDGNLYLVKDGKEAARFCADARIDSACVIDRDGKVYFGTSDGKLRAVSSIEADIINRQAELEKDGGVTSSVNSTVEQDNGWLIIDGCRLAVNRSNC